MKFDSRDTSQLHNIILSRPHPITSKAQLSQSPLEDIKGPPSHPTPDSTAIDKSFAVKVRLGVQGYPAFMPPSGVIECYELGRLVIFR